jgi:hypothetical protein
VGSPTPSVIPASRSNRPRTPKSPCRIEEKRSGALRGVSEDLSLGRPAAQQGSAGGAVTSQCATTVGDIGEHASGFAPGQDPAKVPAQRLGVGNVARTDGWPGRQLRHRRPTGAYPVITPPHRGRHRVACTGEDFDTPMPGRAAIGRPVRLAHMAHRQGHAVLGCARVGSERKSQAHRWRGPHSFPHGVLQASPSPLTDDGQVPLAGRRTPMPGFSW